MILFGIEILIATYVGTKVVETFRAKNFKERTQKKNKKVQNYMENNVDTYLKISIASVALTTIGYF
jgi:hypothetical protein